MYWTWSIRDSRCTKIFITSLKSRPRPTSFCIKLNLYGMIMHSQSIVHYVFNTKTTPCLVIGICPWCLGTVLVYDTQPKWFLNLSAGLQIYGHHTKLLNQPLFGLNKTQRRRESGALRPPSVQISTASFSSLICIQGPCRFSEPLGGARLQNNSENFANKSLILQWSSWMIPLVTMHRWTLRKRCLVGA